MLGSRLCAANDNLVIPGAGAGYKQRGCAAPSGAAAEQVAVAPALPLAKARKGAHGGILATPLSDT